MVFSIKILVKKVVRMCFEADVERIACGIICSFEWNQLLLSHKIHQQFNQEKRKIIMEKILAGKYVELVYEIFVVNNDEQISVFKFNKEHPDAFVFGLDLSLIEGFQNHIMASSECSA